MFHRILGALHQWERWRIEAADPHAGRIVAETGPTWKSWGEKIPVHIAAVADRRTRLTVHSRSLVRTNMVDFGKNGENVR